MLKTFRSDRLLNFIKIYITKYLGVSIENFSFSTTRFSNNIISLNSPILFFSLSENDPSIEI